MLDYDRLLAPIADDAPCGPDLRDEIEFRDLEEAPAGFAGQNAAELRQVVHKCDDMLSRSKDHVPALIAFQAAVRLGDLPLAAAALAVVQGFAETYWDNFHPAPADEMAPARLNELGSLSRPAAVALPLERAALASLPAPSTQGFTGAMLAAAAAPVAEWSSADQEALANRIETGQVTAAAARSEQPTREGARTLRAIMRTVSAAARAADGEAGIASADLPMSSDAAETLAELLRGEVQASRDTLAAMSDSLYTLNEIYDRQAGETASLGAVLSAVGAGVSSCDSFLAAFAPEPDPYALLDDGGFGGADELADGEAGERAAAGRAGRFVPSVPQSRDDVLQAIDAIARYYRAQEPTSPLPLMLERLRPWVSMDFMELLNEIAPSSVSEAQALLAVRTD